MNAKRELEEEMGVKDAQLAHLFNSFTRAMTRLDPSGEIAGKRRSTRTLLSSSFSLRK